MKFLHIADLHIGKILNAYSLLEEQIFILNNVLDLMKEHDVNKLLISGDIYDRSIPSGEAVKVFNDFIEKAINEYHYEIFLITGNHDSKERLSFGKEILKSSNLYIESYASCPISRYILNDEFGKINLYMLPYTTPLELKVKYEEDLKSFDDMMNYVINNSNIDFNERNILLTHQTILHNNTYLKTDSEYNISIGGSEGFDSKILSKFDYVGAGHLHMRQHIGSNIHYSGSIYKYSASEINSPKYALVIDIKEKGNIEVKELELIPNKDLILVRGLFEDLVKDSSNQVLDYSVIVLEDKQVIPNAMARLRIKYPFAVSLNYSYLDKMSNSTDNIIETDNSLSTIELFTNFYKYTTDNDLTDNQKDIINSLLGGNNDASN